MTFILSIAYSSIFNPESIPQLNGLVDNGTVSEIDLWTDGIHMIESGKRIIANNLINSLN